TREGFVFKVDARLRPSGSSGPIVITQEAFLKYHESKPVPASLPSNVSIGGFKQGAEIWERQAMLKARFAAGDMGFGGETISKLHNIIYAGKPDDKDINELLRIRKRMELEIAKETSDRYNIKTGKGGLVDIEFAVQVLQLKYGGDIEGIRSANTLLAMDRLLTEGIINSNDCDTLKDAYNFYRLMENRIRIVHDRADDVIVRGSDDVLKLAKRLGFEGDDAGDRLMECYLNHSWTVREIYTKVMQ
ncbi:MAG: bifunctional [glutamate--ammonia ligase]-adenylyl-L-tyrosine phosphorylase/[glutamate--ammonia-ligase] adenylyltransferase, partial [Deltaproteobacteria bacterium]|nr:bifunctional [glutamate--ammonia ligase]-adenylyl-L-tyrosine phosphorylase/[glutamate--ammonia-ligase] adenylyltransferase [Deltaproteobacteria bacterium]